MPMEHTHLVARILREVAAARTAIATNYELLWQSAERSLDANREDRGADTDPDPVRARGDRSPPDAG
jgi:hypothetical protein